MEAGEDVPAYPDLPSPFLENLQEFPLVEVELHTPPPKYDNWFKDGVFQKELKKDIP